jgi:acetoin utilization deacetylase AcuC-like enzyme
MKVFYRPEMVGPEKIAGSPSPGKPGKVVDSWVKRFGDDITLASFPPATHSQIIEAHDAEYVMDVMDGVVPNGFGTIDPALSKTLPFTVGSILHATLHALRTKQCTVSPTSGFHHAGFRHGAGYCTFNGLMVAAAAVRLRESRVASRDADMHYGDGTDEIRKRVDLEDSVRHWSVGEYWSQPGDAEAFLDSLPVAVETLCLIPEPVDVLIYQAGADPHIHDPLGGWLTTAQLAQRDRIVFTEAKRLGIPVVWNLAGGYQDPIEKVIDIHVNTMREALEVYRGQ